MLRERSECRRGPTARRRSQGSEAVIPEASSNRPAGSGTAAPNGTTMLGVPPVFVSTPALFSRSADVTEIVIDSPPDGETGLATR